MPAGSFTAKLDHLIQEPYFNTFDKTLNIKNLDFKVAFYIMQDITPIQHATLLQLLSNQCAYRASYQVEDQKVKSQDTLIRQAYTITSIIYFSRAKKQFNFFILLMDIYLVDFGVKKRVFKILFSFRLYHSYHSANYIINSIAKEAEVC